MTSDLKFLVSQEKFGIEEILKGFFFQVIQEHIVLLKARIFHRIQKYASDYKNLLFLIEKVVDVKHIFSES